jgi:3-oxochol-4-en-24-oyl-CoA dehydrogenase
MAIGLTADQQALAAAVGEWAAALDAPALVKRSEAEGTDAFAPASKGLADMGVAGIALPEDLGGGAGSLLDLAVAVEACAGAMVPGVLVPTAAAALALARVRELARDAADVVRGCAMGAATVAVGLGSSTLTSTDVGWSGSASTVWGAGAASHLLLPAGEHWLLLDAGEAEVDVATPVDLASRVGTVRLDGAEALAVALDADLLERLLVTLVAAETSGIAHWCVRTATAYAKTREQFGRTIGSFQALKHLCARMLEQAESATAVAWDAASCAADSEQHALASAVAGAAALDLAVQTAHDCIQVLGGIGYTWEHDAHLYLRRAMTNRLVLGGSDRFRLALADQARSGVRRVARLELGAEADAVRAEVAALVDEVAARPAAERRAALVETGLLMPHWPPPYGRGAKAVEQLVIDEELARIGISRPSLGIGAWAGPTIVTHGSDEQQERFLPPTLRGEMEWCQLFSEPGAGSDLAALRTRAERTEDRWVLTGQKVWTSLAAEAHWGICLARTNPDAPKHKGITYFLLDMSTPGITIRPLRELTGDALFNEVFLDGVIVPDDCVVGEVDGGWALARTTLANERVAISDSSFGVSVERALRAAGADPSDLVRQRLGAAVADAGVSKALGLRSTLRTLEGAGPGAESSVQKLVGVRERQDSAQLALDLLGEDVVLGRGEGPAALHEALVTRCLSIAGGTTQVLLNVVGERILGLPRD